MNQPCKQRYNKNLYTNYYRQNPFNNDKKDSLFQCSRLIYLQPNQTVPQFKEISEG